MAIDEKCWKVAFLLWTPTHTCLSRKYRVSYIVIKLVYQITLESNMQTYYGNMETNTAYNKM